ncbi:hypothetical protein EYC84_007629 [Monilinia fructicola]|uniref:Secreted protein n=1 Tax=Monilinia fructicola TaxID=38448 RepID=A0A5M9JNM2_MONFR|nr:hypothetical protein EYC84_007629 [Monilinia fructicola]
MMLWKNWAVFCFYLWGIINPRIAQRKIHHTLSATDCSLNSQRIRVTCTKPMLIHKLYLMDFIIILHNATSISTTPNAMDSFLIHALGFSFCYELHASRSNTHQSSLLHQTLSRRSISQYQETVKTTQSIHPAAQNDIK